GKCSGARPQGGRCVFAGDVARIVAAATFVLSSAGRFTQAAYRILEPGGFSKTGGGSGRVSGSANLHRRYSRHFPLGNARQVPPSSAGAKAPGSGGGRLSSIGFGGSARNRTAL